ncbi:uncharacterized protein EAF02_011760 [Botrytis sinoallii]|uniref:uncharacterized protein n=1 Tax=Botrytis sinoallii TaxID=1463999 RepID=UPI0019012E7D|nr:uncharacterized protein EAF02_011760 [Botrytis sinoallii]KAF7854142.1 hypothetical protein EAF02_011760 [Botrytis sinoallii]
MARGNLWKSRSKSATTVVPIDTELSERFGLFHLNPIPVLPKNGESPYRIDIVALHGIKGDAFRTWTEKNEDGVKNLWLRDQLPNELPGARIFTFGYDANVLFSRGTGTIEDFATALLEDLLRERSNDKHRKRRIIFICHSMGGIVVKKALIRAFNIKLYRNIFELTSAILFLATPHMGSDETKLPLLISKFANGLLALPMRFSGRVRDELITPLSRGSSVLIETQDEFKRLKLYDGIRVASFLEMDICSGLKGLVVDEESAQLHIPDERVVKMHGCDHRNICRFSGPESSSYKSVWGILKVYADEASSLVEDDLTPEDESVLSSIYYPEMEQRRRNANNAYPGTCTWISQDPSYLRWKDTQRSLMWIKGKPGAGKSTLMAYILSNFRNRDSRLLVLNFFFHGRGAPLQKGPEGMYRQLLYQLYSQASPIREQLRKSFAEKNASRQIESVCLWTEEELKTWLFNSIVWIAQSRPVTLFVDALDEAGDDNARILIDYFDDMKKRVSQDEDGGSLRICVSCRHYPNVTLSEGFEVLVENGNSQDIRDYVHDELNSRVLLWDGDPAAIQGRKNMEKAIVKQSEGVFQWVKLVVPKVAYELNEGASLNDIRVMLEKVPNDLGRVYKDILANVIKAKYRSKTLLLMQWISLAFRPLNLIELRFALALDEPLQRGQLSCREREEFVETDARMKILTKSLSGGLVEVVLYTSGQYMVQFIHQTVVDFMISDGLKFLLASVEESNPGRLLQHAMKLSDDEIVGSLHDRLARACTNYFKSGELTQQGTYGDLSPDELDAQYNTYAFGIYAHESWLKHAEAAERRGILQDGILQDIETYGLLKRWLNFSHAPPESNYFGHDAPDEVRLLHIFAAVNLQGPSKTLLERGVSAMASNSWNTTAMHYAAANGHIEIVRILIEAGANASISQPDDDYNTPLDLAARKGHKEVLKFLLENGADINGNSVGANALHTAARAGMKDMVQFLLNAGAQVNATSSIKGDALQSASSEGRVEVVKLLLENGAIFQGHEDSLYGNPLSAAAHKGSFELVDLFLQRGISINTSGGRYGNPLQSAVNAQHIHPNIEFIRYLLSKGADVNAQGGQDGSALQAAVNRHGRPLEPHMLEIIHLLLEKGADVNISGGTAGGVLQAAAASGHDRLVQLFIEHGASIDSSDGLYGSALTNACYHGHKSTVRLLLRAGAKMYSDELPGLNTPLEAAAEGGHTEIVKILLDAGADVSDEGADRIALHFAVKDKVIFELIHNHGANINALGGRYENVLQAAAREGNLEVMAICLDHGVDINKTGGGFGNALQAAILSGSQAFTYLLNRGADPFLKGGKFGTTLQTAAYQGAVEIVKTLLELGLRDEACGFWGSALEAAEHGIGNSADKKTIVDLLVERGGGIRLQPLNRKSSASREQT